LNTKFLKTLELRIRPYKKAQHLLVTENFGILGAEGEENVVQELKKLPDTYYVINDYQIHLQRYVYYKKYREYVRSCQIDHVVVGPTGIYLIETKNWSQNTYNKSHLSGGFSPEHQIERCSLLFYLKHQYVLKRFEIKPYSIVAFTNPIIPYCQNFVYSMQISDLIRFIQKKKYILDQNAINHVLRALNININ
jgi:hypothetical protein